MDVLPILPRGIKNATRYGGMTRKLPRSLELGSLKLESTDVQALACFSYVRKVEANLGQAPGGV